MFQNRTAVVANGERTEFLLDPLGLVNVIGEYDAGGSRTVSYAYGFGLESATTASETHYYDYSDIGSTAGLTGATGAYVNQYAYQPFGETMHRGETVDNSFEFVGQFGVRTEGNGLSFMRARYYSL